MPGVSDAPEVKPGADASRPIASRAEVIGTLAIVLGTVAIVAGGRLITRLSAHPTAAECEALLARYVEMKERAVSEKIDRERYEIALDNARQSAGGPTFTACTTEVTQAEANCVRRAGNADEIERCLR